MKAIFFFFFLPFLGFNQLVFEKTVHDFGDLNAESERFVDIRVTNQGKKKEYFLSFRKPTEISCLSNGQYILPDSSLFIRIQPNPVKKGRFSYDIEVFTSDKQEATVIKVKGNLAELPENAAAFLTACPDFNNRPALSRSSSLLTVKTIDKNTREPIPASVFLIQNGIDILQVATNKKGIWKDKVPPGFIYFYAKAESYKPVELGAYVNFQRNEVVLELEKDPAYCMPVPLPKTDSLVQKDSLVLAQEPILLTPLDLKQELMNEVSSQSDSVPPLALAQLPVTDFSENHFKPLNVVFVLDVSGSMKNDDKFNLMKFALGQLLEILRPQDKIGLVTYADEAAILLPSTNCSDKSALKTKVSALVANGNTAGSAGIKLGFKEVEKNFIPNGTNMVIVITDGAFNKNSGDYIKIIEKYHLKNIQLSVVGVKNAPKDESNLKEAAKTGGGRYVPVFKLADAQQNLIQEIRVSCFK